MRKILFRADAAPHIGIGDLMSLIHLSRYLEDIFEIHFMIQKYQAGVSLVKKYVLENVVILREEITLNEEIESINKYIRKKEIDIIFFEITERNLSLYQGVNSNVKKVAVNFNKHILNDLDLLIDWDVTAPEIFDTVKYPKTKFLLGPKYVILPKEFYSKKVIDRNNSLQNKNLLIAMGGADELNFTQKVVDVLVNLNLDIELNIIIGSGYNYKKELEDSLAKSRLKYEIKQNVVDMLSEYLNCDIGIGAGGLTSSELIAAKTSAILIATYEHQVARCKYFAEQGWARFLGYREFKSIDLEKAIKCPILPTDKMLFNTQEVANAIKEL